MAEVSRRESTRGVTTTEPAHADRTGRAGTSLTQPLAALALGAAVALALGTYGRLHDPSGQALTTLGFATQLQMKAWLTTAALALGGVQLVSALAMYGRLGRRAQWPWIGPLHRTSGLLAFLTSLPVAAHCLWSLGFSTFDARTTAHSILGCAFYGAFAAKMLSLRSHGGPKWLLPVLGSAVLTVLAGLWLTASLWYFRHF
jgi:Family of unknown function (DUF6529)